MSDLTPNPEVFDAEPGPLPDDMSEKPAEQAAETPSEKPAEAGMIRENVASLLATAVLALFFTTFIAQAFEIPSESMEDTLLVGDRPFVNKLSFAPSTNWLKWRSEEH